MQNSFGVYTFTGTPEGSDLDEYAAIFGDECAFDRPTEPLLVSTDPDVGIQNLDNDTCLDAGNEDSGNSAFIVEGFKFQENLEIPCATQYGESLLALQACFTYRQK